MPRRARLAVLLSLLGATLLFALHDLSSRRARTHWQRPITVAVALVQLGPIDQAALDALNGRLRALEVRLASEYHRYGGQLAQPVSFTLFGPVSADRAAPPDPDSNVFSLAHHALELWRFTHAIDQACALPTSEFDSRIYLIVRAPKQKDVAWVEGSSEFGGRVGTASVEFDASSIDIALFVVAHELFHTLGASDKYDSTGHTLIPDGLVEPDRVPRFPQRFAEVMARNRVLAPGSEQPPDTLADLGVGIATARELGWAPPAR